MTVIAAITSRGEIPGESEPERLACEYLDEGVLDSMGMVELVLELERLYGIHFEPEDMQSEEFRTIGGLVAIVERLVAQSGDA